jgi:hypothetical protein
MQNVLLFFCDHAMVVAVLIICRDFRLHFVRPINHIYAPVALAGLLSLHSEAIMSPPSSSPPSSLPSSSLPSSSSIDFATALEHLCNYLPFMQSLPRKERSAASKCLWYMTCQVVLTAALSYSLNNPKPRVIYPHSANTPVGQLHSS